MFRSLADWTASGERDETKIHCTGVLTPRAIADLLAMPHLAHLTLEDIDAFPRELAALSSLRVLRIRAPSLTTLPDEIADLESLVELDLRETRIRELPPRMEARARARVIFVWRATS